MAIIVRCRDCHAAIGDILDVGPRRFRCDDCARAAKNRCRRHHGSNISPATLDLVHAAVSATPMGTTVEESRRRYQTLAKDHGARVVSKTQFYAAVRRLAAERRVTVTTFKRGRPARTMLLITPEAL